ncbi:MAG: DUF4255 domain-containing protein [Bacteroidota bacterium]
MIFKALEYIRHFLEEQMKEQISGNGNSSTPFSIDLDNVSKVDTPNSTDENRLIITLVNTEEEYTKKNYSAARKNYISGNVSYSNPPIFINLYVLFAANNSNYNTALKTLSDVIKCFQAKNSFTVSNTALDTNEINLSLTDELTFKLDFELYTLTFEQLNHLWGTLGGKQIPAVMYKVRLIRLEKTLVQSQGGVIENILIENKG